MALMHKSATATAARAAARPVPVRAAHALTLRVRAEAEAVAPAAAAAAAPAAKPAAPAKPAWTVPTLDPATPSPVFGGSTGGLLKKAQVEEFYVITWTAQKEAIFEMPTGGAAIMRQGPNLLKLAKKEQCLALTTQLRSKFKLAPCFYRVFPDGKVEYLHPADGESFWLWRDLFALFVFVWFDPQRGAFFSSLTISHADPKTKQNKTKQTGVYPEKVNAGRVGMNQNFRRIGDNVNPIKVKFTGKGPAEV